MLPVSSPSMGCEELAKIQEVLASRWLGLGAVTKQFEEKVSAFLDPSGKTSVVGVNSGTTALHLALEALGVTIGAEVVLPSLTFVATAQVITALGAVPVFCDVEDSTLNLDPIALERCLSAQTRAVIPVHFRGLACDMDAIQSLCAPRSVPVVEDAAHAFGSRHGDRMIGGMGDVTCFSFDPIKNITCGEGGAVVTRDEALSERLRRKRILGINKDTWSRQEQTRPWSYNVVEQGYRYHMPNLNAAIGLAQLEKFPVMQGRKNAIAQIYDSEFASLPGIAVIPTPYGKTALFSYMIRVLENKRDALMVFLKQSGVDSGVHYIPVHHFDFFKPFARHALPITDVLFDQILTLPLFADMKDIEVEQVLSAVKQWTLHHS